MSLRKNAGYFIWAARNYFRQNTNCPSCGSSNTRMLKRKAVVTSLHICEECCLMYRCPKSSYYEAELFYQTDYNEGVTTNCPNDQELRRLKHIFFRDTEKDYTNYIKILKAAKILPGQSLFDFGASWGYGSWQFMQAGYEVFSYEINVSRSNYAREKLGCNMLSDPKMTTAKVDCFFSAHVIEHLPNPCLLWETANSVLKPDGKVVLLMPNGDPSRERVVGRKMYHQLWGQVHPLLFTSLSLSNIANRFGFIGFSYSSPFNLEMISNYASENNLIGDELLFIAHRVVQ